MKKDGEKIRENRTGTVFQEMGGLVRDFKVLPFTLSAFFFSLAISLLFIKCHLMWIELAYHPGTSVC